MLLSDETSASRLLLVCAALTCVSVVAASAQDTTRRWRRPNVLKTNLLAPPSLFYERALGRRFALRLSSRWWQFGVISKDTRFVNVTVEGKIYTAKASRLMRYDHPAGFYVNPYVKARRIRYVNEIGTGPGNPPAYDEVMAESLGFGLTVGYMWVFRSGIVLELQHGGGFMPPALTNYWHTGRYGTVTSNSGIDYLQLDFRSGVSLGYAF